MSGCKLLWSSDSGCGDDSSPSPSLRRTATAQNVPFSPLGLRIRRSNSKAHHRKSPGSRE